VRAVGKRNTSVYEYNSIIVEKHSIVKKRKVKNDKRRRWNKPPAK
jgi:hypothetical protein